MAYLFFLQWACGEFDVILKSNVAGWALGHDRHGPWPSFCSKSLITYPVTYIISPYILARFGNYVSEFTFKKKKENSKKLE